MDFSDAKDFAMTAWFGGEYSDVFTYNGESIRGHLNYVGGQSAIAHYATLTVQTADVPAPSYRDTVVIGGTTWRVFQQEEITGDGLTWEIPLNRDERPNFK